MPSPLKRPFGPEQPAGTFAASVPQSQHSFPSFMPLPQVAWVHWLGLPPAGGVQLEPGSRRHCETAVAVHGVAVVALLVRRDHAVSAERDAGPARHSADVALLDRARGRATVAVLHVVVVARLRSLQHPIAAGRGASTWLARPSGNPIRLPTGKAAYSRPHRSGCCRRTAHPGSSAPLPHLVVLMTTPSTGGGGPSEGPFPLPPPFPFPSGCPCATGALFHAGAAGGEGKANEYHQTERSSGTSERGSSRRRGAGNLPPAFIPVQGRTITAVE